MTPYLTQAAAFLLKTVFETYILMVLLRLMLQLTRADFYNPLAQFIVKVTNPPLLPLRRIIPGVGGIDWASVILLGALEVAKLYLAIALYGASAKLSGVLILAGGELLELVIYVFLVTVLIRAILSWVNPYGGNPAMSLLINLSEPVMRPARQLIPSFSGLDLSPMVVIIILNLALILLIQPILDLGRGLMLSP